MRPSYVKAFLYSLWALGFSWTILFLILFSPVIIIGMLQGTESLTLYQLMIFGAFSASAWIIALVILLSPVLFLSLLVFIVGRDIMKFKKAGIDISPPLWILGMIFPSNIIVFPAYLIKRKIFWVPNLTNMNKV